MGDIGLAREQAWVLVMGHIESENLRRHCLATEAVMRRVAARLGENVDDWGLTGLLHDLDLDIVGKDMQAHARRTAEILGQAGVHPRALDAILRHNDALGLARESRLDHALAACETITGLVVATALVVPGRNLASVKAKSVVKRMKEKAFAASVNREIIRECEQVGIPLAEFAQIALEAMQEIAPALGLDGGPPRPSPAESSPGLGTGRAGGASPA